MSAKNREHNIVARVYDVSSFSIEPSESPDFVLTKKSENGARPFGVEVAELYSSESTARLHNVRGYLHRILDKNEYIHKKDKRSIPARKVRLISPEGDSQEITGIIEYTKGTDILDSLCKLIRVKNNKMLGYNKELVHHNLVIDDYERFLVPDEKNALVVTPELGEAIRLSRFREIFVASKANKFDGYLPLKLFLLHFETMAFITSLKENQQLLKEYAKEDFLLTFYGFLTESGYTGVSISRSNEVGNVFFSRYQITQPKGIVIRTMREAEEAPLSEDPLYDKELVSKLIAAKHDQYEDSVSCFFSSETGKIRE